MGRFPLLAALLTASLAASGCFSTSSGPSGTTGPDPGATGGGAVNATTEYSCTASPGGVVGGGGENVATVSGCAFTKLTQSAVYVRGDIPAGCDVSYFEEDSDNVDNSVSDGAPSAGRTYAAGTTFSMGCGPNNPTGKGTIHLRLV